jgi:competence protein ComEA
MVFVLAMALLVAVLGTCNYRRSASPPVAVDQDIWVHVSGCVLTPGVYRLASGSRVYDAIEMAGGALECGDVHRLNLASRLVDGQKIHIPRKPQEGADWGISNGLININYADQRLLETLPGIGPAIAQRIIEYRERTGGFSSIEEITKVERIGPAIFEKIKDLITVDGPAR